MVQSQAIGSRLINVWGNFERSVSSIEAEIVDVGYFRHSVQRGGSTMFAIPPTADAESAEIGSDEHSAIRSLIAEIWERPLSVRRGGPDAGELKHGSSDGVCCSCAVELKCAAAILLRCNWFGELNGIKRSVWTMIEHCPTGPSRTETGRG